MPRTVLNGANKVVRPTIKSVWKDPDEARISTPIIPPKYGAYRT